MIGRAIFGLFLFVWLVLPPNWAAADSSMVLEINAPSPRLSRYIAQTVQTTSPRLLAWTGRKPKRIIIYVYASQESFSRQMALLGAPTWAAGLALPRSGQIHLKGPGLLSGVSEFDHVLAHELLHLQLAPAMGGKPLPLWLEEGLAVLLSGESGWRRSPAMARSVLMGELPSLSALAQHFPPGHSEASEAYAVSYFFVSWFLNQYGDTAMHEVVRSLGNGLEPTAAFRRATGLSLAKLEGRFRLSMEERFSWFSLLTSSGVFWGMVAVMAALALIVGYRRQKSRRRAMDNPDRDLLHIPPGRLWPPPKRRADVLSEAGQRSEERWTANS